MGPRHDGGYDGTPWLPLRLEALALMAGRLPLRMLDEFHYMHGLTRLDLQHTGGYLTNPLPLLQVLPLPPPPWWAVNLAVYPSSCPP